MKQHFRVLSRQDAPERLIDVPRGLDELPVVERHRIIDLQRATEGEEVVLIGGSVRAAVFVVDIEPILDALRATRTG